jgi:hypothetical protein
MSHGPVSRSLVLHADNTDLAKPHTRRRPTQLSCILNPPSAPNGETRLEITEEIPELSFAKVLLQDKTLLGSLNTGGPTSGPDTRSPIVGI